MKRTECRIAFEKWLIEVKDLMFAERGAWEAWEASWSARPPKPVSISLEKCADAVGDVINRGGPSLRFEDKDIAKAVLDAAKAQGERFHYE